MLLGLLWTFRVEARVLFPKDMFGTNQMYKHSRTLLQNVQENIAAGTDAPCSRFPYMASLRTTDDVHKCGGVLIASEWIVTAAHCVDERSGLWPNMIIAVGSCQLRDMTGIMDSGRTVERFRNLDIHMHPNWTGRLEDGSDIALVRLRGASVNQPVPLAIRTNALVNVNAVTALGWGGTSDDESAENLQITNNLRLLENKYCDDESDGWGDIIQESMICTSGLREGLDTCEGDSGGPLLMAFAPGGLIEKGAPDLDTLVGITSFGEDSDCGASPLPSVYTRVTSFNEWIAGITGQNPGSASMPDGHYPEHPGKDPSPPHPQSPPPASPSKLPSSALPPPPHSSMLTMRVAAETAAAPPVPPDCSCSLDGVSDGVATGLGGCHRHLPDGVLLCYTEFSQGCRQGFQSVLFPGAHWMRCMEDQGVLQLPESVELSHEGRDEANEELLRIAPMADTSGDQVRELLTNGANPEFRSGSNIPVLHLVAASGNLAVASALVEAGADIDTKDDFGWTAVHVASAVGRVDLVSFLVAAGANVDMLSIYDQSPLKDVCSLVANCPDGAVQQIVSLLS